MTETDHIEAPATAEVTEIRIAALLTCHNRRASTVAAVERVLGQRVADVAIDVLVFDAGSTDGTAEALAAFEDVNLVRGDDSYFWNGGMREVFLRAVEVGYDFYLWLNDDTLLDHNALAHLLATHRGVTTARPGEPAIVAGATRDPDTGALTYGGVRRTVTHRPLRFDLVDVTAAPEPCETINGNIVLIPHDVVARIGVLDQAFTHAIGDFDYGLRARKAGCGVWVAADTIGSCRRNDPPQLAAVGAELRRLRGPKGLPVNEWMTFARRWGGPLWLLYALSPYVRRLVVAAIGMIRGTVAAR